MVARDNNDYSPDQLLGGGEHFDDITKQQRQQITRHYSAQQKQFPHERMLRVVEDKHLSRKLPKGWNSTDNIL